VADDLYASLLPLARLRYATVVPVAAPAGPYAMPFDDMGITVTVDQFNRLSEVTPVFRDRLRRWGLDSAAPIGTLITARSVEEMRALVQGHPEVDFLVPGRYREALGGAPQVWVDTSADFFLLLSRTLRQRDSAPSRSCRM